MQMSRNKASKIQYKLIELFDKDFRVGKASISNTGAIKFTTERSFGIYYQLFELLRGSKPGMADELVRFLRKQYKNKTLEDLSNDFRPNFINEGDALIAELRNIGVEVEGEF